MGLKCGIVGLPNVGKSTLFNALTKAGIAAENYPFCTIEPNVGIVEVPDPRLAKLAEIVSPQRIDRQRSNSQTLQVQLQVQAKAKASETSSWPIFVNAMLLAHIVRCFNDDNIVHVAGHVDPLEDISVINMELALADLASVDKQLNKYTKQARSGGDKEALKLVTVLENDSSCPQ